jgi:hypothetical protein
MYSTAKEITLFSESDVAISGPAPQPPISGNTQDKGSIKKRAPAALQEADFSRKRERRIKRRPGWLCHAMPCCDRGDVYSPIGK